jgi:SSS family solute:Na+ symporter
MAIAPLDVIIILVYLVAVTFFGMRFRKGDRSLKSYFLGEENTPWWAISLSIVAAETSTLTLVSIPGLAYQGNYSFLQLVLGYVLGRIVIARFLLPRYFQNEIFTAYEWIRNRFGVRLQRVTAAVFLVTRATAEGVRVYAVSIVIAAVSGKTGDSFGTDAVAIGGVMALTLLYTYHGGLTAVIWTDVLQIAIYTTATGAGLLALIHAIPGGTSEFLRLGAEHGKFHWTNFSWDLSNPYTFYAGVIGGTFFTVASHGTDQLMVQRLLAARDEKKARLALVSSGVFVFLQFGFYLTIGAALFVYSLSFPPEKPWARSDLIFPDFIVHHMPLGLRGLLLAAILAAAMSNLSAALNSLASTTVIDFGKLFKSPHKAILFWTGVLFLLALEARHGGRVVETGLSIASVAYGCLLGVFLTGLLSRKVGENAALLGMLGGLVTNLVIWRFSPLAFPWYVPLGSMVTMILAFIVN